MSALNSYQKRISALGVWGAFWLFLFGGGLIANECEARMKRLSTSEIPPHDLIDRQIEAYRARDIEAFSKFYSDDVIAYRNNEVFVSGIADLRSKYRDLFELSPNLAVRISERKIEGEFVHDTEHIRGLRGNADEIIAKVRYKVVDSKIVEVIITR